MGGIHKLGFGGCHKLQWATFLQLLYPPDTESTENLLKSCKKALKINLEIHGGIHKLGFGGFHKLQRGPSQIYGR